MGKGPSRRAEGFTESVIREMTRLCQAYNAINLAQGFPDFDPPDKVKIAASQAIRDGYNQYSTTHGVPRLRQAIARKMSTFNHVPCNADDNVTVTCGTTEGMIASLLALLNPSEEVIIFEPFYENYGPDSILSGAKCKYVGLEEPGFKIEEEKLKEAFPRRQEGPRFSNGLRSHTPAGGVHSRSGTPTIILSGPPKPVREE